MKRTLVLWLVLLAGPTIWFINLEASFAVAGWVCQWQSRLVLALLSVASLLIVAASGLLAWRQWRDVDGAVGSHPRALATGGAVLSALSFIVIVAQTIPTVLLDGCQ